MLPLRCWVTSPVRVAALVPNVSATAGQGSLLVNESEWLAAREPESSRPANDPFIGAEASLSGHSAPVNSILANSVPAGTNFWNSTPSTCTSSTFALRVGWEARLHLGDGLATVQPPRPMFEEPVPPPTIDPLVDAELHFTSTDWPSNVLAMVNPEPVPATVSDDVPERTVVPDWGCQRGA